MRRRAGTDKGSARLAIVWTVFSIWAALITWRLYELQVLRHDEYARRADRQQQRVVEIDPPRGTIYDARGRELAVSVEVESAFAVPREIEDPVGTARAVAGVLSLDASRLERQLGTDREFVWLERKLDPPLAERLRRLDLVGVHFLRESKRYYPQRELAAAVLGYVGTDNHGLAGLEAAYDSVVAGRPGRRTVLRDARRGTVVSPVLSFAEPEPGEDLHLTIDSTLQYMLEQRLREAAVRHGARSANAVFLDPRSGAVVAMASWPSFDPNRFADATADERRNRVVQDAYEPGSTFKMVTATAALEANAMDPADLIDCEMGGIVLAGVRIEDHKSFGLLSFRDVVAQSSNVGAIKIGLRAGGERLYRTLRDFGFGEPLGIDLPGESGGILRPYEKWPPLQKAYVSFGQGLSVTPLQLAAAFAAVGGEGRLLRPYVVARRGDAETGRLLHASPELVRQVASAATVRSVERMLEAVVEEGTGKRAAVPGFAVAGKTGTAQKAVPGGYSADRHVASFAGFAPARRPVLAGVVTIDEPRGALYHGGDVAAPIFGDFAREALLYLGVEPSATPDERWPHQAPPQDPSPTRLAAMASETLEPASGMVPDLAGLPARQALQRAALTGLRPVLRGHGFVSRQSPLAGSPVAGNETLELWLEPGRAR